MYLVSICLLYGKWRVAGNEVCFFTKGFTLQMSVFVDKIFDYRVKLSYVVVLTKGALKLYIVLMAKQAGEFFIEGSFDDLCFYKMDGKYYVRMKSSLNSKKFWKHKAFEGSRRSCERFAEGNRLASKLYRMVEEEKRVYSLFCFLKKKAILLLKEGKSLFEVEETLFDYLIEFGLVERKEHAITVEEIMREKYGDAATAPLSLVCFTVLLKADSS